MEGRAAMDMSVGGEAAFWRRLASAKGLAAALPIRFFTTGGLPMLRMMGGAPDAEHDRTCRSDNEHH